jgi:hypothetical protein
MHACSPTARAVAKLVEEITQVKLLGERFGATVIRSTALFVSQDMVCLGNFLEPIFRLTVTWIYIWMMLSSLFPVRFLDFGQWSTF